MSFANKHNKGAIDWKIDTKDFKFVSRKEAYEDAGEEAVYTLRGLYINRKGRYDDHPVAITNDCFIDFPDYMTEEVIEILNDKEDIEDIIAGKVGFSISQFTDKKFNRTCYGINWVDLEN